MTQTYTDPFNEFLAQLEEKYEDYLDGDGEFLTFKEYCTMRMQWARLNNGRE